MGMWLAAVGVVGIVAGEIVVIMVYVAGLRTRMAILGGTGYCLLTGTTIGSLAVYIAMGHNPQGEFIDQVTGAVNHAHLSALFLSWFVVVGLVASLALAFLAGLFAD